MVGCMKIKCSKVCRERQYHLLGHVHPCTVASGTSFWARKGFVSLKATISQAEPGLRLTALRLQNVYLLDNVGGKGAGTWRSSEKGRNKVTKLL